MFKEESHESLQAAIFYSLSYLSTMLKKLRM